MIKVSMRQNLVLNMGQDLESKKIKLFGRLDDFDGFAQIYSRNSSDARSLITENCSKILLPVNDSCCFVAYVCLVYSCAKFCQIIV